MDFGSCECNAITCSNRKKKRRYRFMLCEYYRKEKLIIKPNIIKRKHSDRKRMIVFIKFRINNRSGQGFELVIRREINIKCSTYAGFTNGVDETIMILHY